MDAIDKLYTTISQQFPNERITTKQAATAVGLTRGVTSSYLSQLHKRGKLIKTGTRPVYWQVKRAHSAFDGLIGYRGSLSTDIQHALEAIVYPVNGLPIFMTGIAGSGKLAMARAIYREAVRRQILPATAIFKTVDCASYKDQPEAFKQALNTTIQDFTAEKPGYLYIENLQALNSSAQHYLFNEANQQETTGIRYIFSATQTDSKANGLFFKAAAVQINLKPLNDRPFDERMTFVAMFLQQQANQIGREIMIMPNKLIELAALEHTNNIRELNNRIQLLCAATYAQTPDAEQLIIAGATADAICITPNQSMLTDRIRSLIINVLQLGPTAELLFKSLSESLVNGETLTEQNFAVLKVLNQIDTTISGTLLTAFAKRLQTVTRTTITHRYGIGFPPDEVFWRNVALAFTFASLCSDNLPTNQVLTRVQIELKDRYPRSYYLFNQFLKQLGPQYTQSNYYCLPFFILMAQCTDKVESVHYNAILLAHGEKTASSIQQVVNTLCGNYFFEAFDMPIDVSLEKINEYVRSYLVDQAPATKGNIVLFDMGSLREMFSEIKKISNQELLVVNNVTTAMALDIGLRVQRNETFQSIAEASKKYSSTTDAQYYEGLSNRKNIIVSCMSGVGLSEELKKLIESTLSPSLEVIAVDYKKLHGLLKNHDRQFFANTQLILTTTDVSGDYDLNIMNIYNIFDKSTSLKLQSVLRYAGENQESSDLLIERLLRFLSIEGIRGRLQILNPDIVIQDSQDIVAHYEDFYNVKFSPRLKLNLYMHLSLMIERMIMDTKGSENVIKQDTLTAKEQEFFSLSSGIFQPIEQKFNIRIQDYEIELLYQLLKDFIFIAN